MELSKISMKKKKKRVIRVEVSHEYKEKMEKILVDKDRVFENFDTLYRLTPKHTTHFCGKLLV